MTRIMSHSKHEYTEPEGKLCLADGSSPESKPGKGDSLCTGPKRKRTATWSVPPQYKIAPSGATPEHEWWRRQRAATLPRSSLEDKATRTLQWVTQEHVKQEEGDTFAPAIGSYPHDTSFQSSSDVRSISSCSTLSSAPTVLTDEVDLLKPKSESGNDTSSVSYVADSEDESSDDSSMCSVNTNDIVAKPVKIRRLKLVLTRAPQRSLETEATPEPRPPPIGAPPAWAATRSEICDAIGWFRSAQSGLYTRDGFAFGLLIDRDSGDRSYMDDEIILTRVGGGCSVKDGKLIQTKNHNDKSRPVVAVKRSMEHEIPVGVVIGDRNTICPTTVPHRYNVADFFRVTNVWYEKKDGKVAARMRYEKCNLKERSWWATQETAHPVPLSQRACPEPSELEIKCSSCITRSIKVYSQGWTCLNPRCRKFYIIDGKDAEDLPQLTYDPSFLQMRTRPKHAPRPLNSLVPKTLDTLTECGADKATARICWKGIVCPNCSRCICRTYWQGWVCETEGCGFRHLADVTPIPLRLVIPELEMGAIGHSVPLKLDKGEIKPRIVYMKNYRKDVFEIPGYGTITHLASNAAINARSNGPNEMFQQLQACDLGLKRYPMTTSIVTQMLTSHFAVNFGMPYKYVVNVDSKPFSGAPKVIMTAMSRLGWAAKEALNDDGFQPNELLAVGYFEKMKMGYHDDGEDSLGPTISTLSLGAKAEMTIRMKKKYYKPQIKEKMDLDAEEIIPGCGHYEKRRRLRQEFDEGKIPLDIYLAHRSAIISSIRSSESPVCVRMELNHGDLIVMHGALLQKYYEHAIEPKGDIRFSLTARYVKPEMLNPEERHLGSFDPSSLPVYDGDER